MSKGKLVFSVILLWLGRFSVLVVGTDEESGGLMLISSIHLTPKQTVFSFRVVAVLANTLTAMSLHQSWTSGSFVLV